MEEYAIDSRARLLILARILYEKTDETKGLTADQIIAELQKEKMKSERKTLYKDLDCLSSLGHDVLKNRNGREVYYHIGSRRFEMAELRLLIDAVQASHVLTTKKTKSLIKKLEYFVSDNDAKDFENVVYVTGQRKTTNESIYYLVNDLHVAIKDDCKVAFQYYQWDINKQLRLRHDGKRYDVSPWAMLFDYENYYLLAFDEEKREMRHYRVDKMKNLIILGEKRKGREVFDSYDMGTFTQSIFGMYDAEVEHVLIRASNDLVGVMIDRFGKDIIIHDQEDGTFTFEMDIRVSDHFLGWIIAVGDKVEILKPESLRGRIARIGEGLKNKYSKAEE